MAAEMEKIEKKWPKSHFGAIFPFRWPFFGHFRPGAISHFFPIFFGFLRRTGFPFCRWPPRTQPWSPKSAEFCVLFAALSGIGVCPFVLQKHMLCVPVLHGWSASCGQQIQANVQGPMKQNASPGIQSEAPRRRWKPGQEQQPQPKKARTVFP